MKKVPVRMPGLPLFLGDFAGAVQLFGFAFGAGALESLDVLAVGLRNGQSRLQ